MPSHAQITSYNKQADTSTTFTVDGSCNLVYQGTTYQMMTKCSENQAVRAFSILVRCSPQA